MELLLPILVALAASALTLFTGFGLGTLLLPALVTVLPMKDAVAVTALVHLLNNLFKLTLVGRHAQRELVFSFGVPAMFAAFAGAWTLLALGAFEALDAFTLFGLALTPTPLEIVVGLLIVGMAIWTLRRKKGARVERPDPMTTVRMGVASGFLGGLSGHQGALRSAFLLKLDLPRDAFVGTNVAIACMVDVARLTIYTTGAALAWSRFELWGPVTLAAFVGAFVGVRILGKTRIESLRTLVGVTMIVLGLALAAGLVSK